MLTSFVSLQQGQVKKPRKISENCKYWRRKSSYLLNNMRNFYEMFKKDVAYENIDVTKNQALTLSLENTFLGKPNWSNWGPFFLGLRTLPTDCFWKSIISHHKLNAYYKYVCKTCLGKWNARKPLKNYGSL